MIDLSKIRPGDEVTVRATVVASEFGPYVWIQGPIDKLEVVSHTHAPREIKVGDRVTFRDNKLVYEVVHIKDELAWVSNRNNDTFAHMSNLTHAEDSHE